MRGTQNHTIDGKNRLFVPSKFRDELGTSIVVAKSITSKSIWVYSKENWKEFEDKIGSLPDISANDVLTWLYGNSEDMEIDTQGRIALPVGYTKYAEISKNIISVGVRDHLEIWDEAAFEHRMEATDVSGLRRYLAEHGM